MLALLVYNLDTDSFRYVYIELDAAKSLGMDIGNGYLHQIPVNKQANCITRTENTYTEPTAIELESDYITVIDNRGEEEPFEQPPQMEYVSALVKSIT